PSAWTRGHTEGTACSCWGGAHAQDRKGRREARWKRRRRIIRSISRSSQGAGSGDAKGKYQSTVMRGGSDMRQGTRRPLRALLGRCATVLLIGGVNEAQEAGRGQSSYAPVDIKEDFATTMARMKAAKAEIMQRQL